MPSRKKKKFVVSVKDFGAKGDGVADDTEAFKAAGRTKATKIKMPPGVYEIDEEVELDPRFVSVKRGI